MKSCDIGAVLDRSDGDRTEPHQSRGGHAATWAPNATPACLRMNHSATARFKTHAAPISSALGSSPGRPTARIHGSCVTAWVADHADAQQTLNRAEAAATENGADVARLDQSLAELIALADKDRAAEVTLAERGKELADQIAARELSHPSERGGELAVLSSALADMAQAAVNHTTAASGRAAAEAAGKRAAQSVTEAMAEGAAATAALTVAEAQVTALSAPTEQAALAASDAARDMRLRLEPSAPCPVCGSCDHPAHADAAIADLAARLRTDLSAARQSAQESCNRQAEAHRTCDREQGQVDQALLNVAAAETRITAAHEQWQKAREKALTVGHCPDLPAHPDADPSHLFAIAADIAEAQENEATAQAELSKLRRELGDLATRRDTLLSTISSHAQARDALNVERAEAGKFLALAVQEAQGAQGLVERHTNALRPILENLDETTDVLNAPDLTITLSARVGVVIDLRIAHEAASVSLLELGPKIAAAQSRVDSTQLQAHQAQEGAEARQSALAALQAERAPLLDGEATALHRTRHIEARRAALAAQDAARRAQAASANIAAAAQARADAAEQEKADAETAVTTARMTLDAALAGSELVLVDIYVLFAYPLADVAAARKKLRALDDAVTSVRATVASRKVDREAAQAGGVPEQPIAELAESLTGLDAAATTREQRVGAINEEFRRDAVTRASLAGLDAEIAIAGKERDVWQAVNHAVGSRNGDRFARIAQSITLDVLVDLANQHLVDLNPRYRLRRAADLALQVEDLDMANEARATRSLSGGERFLVSLALALALSRMGGKGGLVTTLFIDEGFGALDIGSLDLAIDALESLQSQGRQVGVISHVAAMKDRIPIQIAVRKQGGGRSVVEINGVG